MSNSPFTLTDRLIGKAFRLLGQGKGHLRDFHVHFDQDGVPWAYKSECCGCIGFTLGPNWLLDAFAVQQRADTAAAERQRLHQLAAGQHRDALDQVLRGLRLGPRTERLALAIHRAVMHARSSVLRIPDRELAVVAWGHERSAWPRHWRRELLASLGPLTSLHIAPGNDQPDFGMQTALLTHIGDLRGTDADICDPDCHLHGGPCHRHFLINVGRGFLGILESCADPDDGSGIRTYSFPVDARNKSTTTLRRLGKSGRLTNFYLPAVLGNHDACASLSHDEHQLLQALVRETTRKTKVDRRELSEAEIISGNSVPLMSNRRSVHCPQLEALGQYVGFNGNGKRKRLGYRLSTPGGWLAKAGYPLDDVGHFLSDLERLAQALGLVIVGLLPSDGTWRSLSQMRDMLSIRSTRATLERLHVRIYTAANYLDRWNAFFGWSNTTPTPPAIPHQNEEVRLQVLRLAQRHGSRRELAAGLGVDPSLLTKVLNGKKVWPTGWLERARDWLAERQQHRTPPVATCSALPVAAGNEHRFAAVALDYLRRGFSVVPQLAGRKQPCVLWKRYQERPPTGQEVEAWAQQWPDAGIALVLGPVSNVFVVDIDGPEAHQVLLDHLGTEPLAPKVWSGSRQPDRYHLFFRCPAIRTKAKATPWHPKLEFRGKGAVVIVPPSVHRSGNAYAWAAGQSLDDLSLPELPAPILAALATRIEPPANPAPLVAVDDLDASPITRDFLTGQYADAPGWNSRLFAATCDLAGRGMPQEQAEHLLLAGASPWNDTERDIARRTIRSAFQEPREPGRR